MKKSQRKKCVAVAQDVLEHMRGIAVAEGTYCEGRLPAGVSKAKDSAKKHIDGISKGCQVCALGACFLSYIRLYNNFSLGQLVGTFSDRVSEDESFEVDYHDMTKELETIFTPAQMCLIETAFEKVCINDDALLDSYYCECEDGDDYDRDEYTTDAEIEAAVLFGQKYENVRLRLRAIMKNIVKNDGLFIPCKKLYDELHVAKKNRIPVEIV